MRNPTTGLFHMLCLLGLLLSSASATATRMEVVTLQHRPADLLLPQLQSMNADTSLTAAGNRIILRGEDAEVAQLIALIHELDQPLAQFRIHVRQSGNRQQQGSGYTVNGQLHTPGNTTIRTGNTGNPERGGLSMNTHSETQRTTTTIKRYSTGSSNDVNQQVRAVEGLSAYIETGQEIPFLSHYRNGYEHGVSQDYKPVVTGFYVTPAQAYGDRVLLEISVQQQRYREHQQGRIDSRGMASSFYAPLGQWVDLGSSLQNQSDDGRSIGRSYSTGNSNDHHIELMVERIE